MGELLERWKAPETVRRNVGWLAIFLGIGGAFGAITGLFVLAGPALVETEEPDAGVPVALAMILLGITVLLCARGLSRGQPWARWAAVAFLVASCARRLPRLVREFELGMGWALVLFSIFSTASSGKALRPCRPSGFEFAIARYISEHPDLPRRDS